MLPAASATNPCGPESGTFVLYSLMAPVFGSTRPSTLARWPVYQIAPSAVASGSCGNAPGVATAHSLTEICALPAAKVGVDEITAQAANTMSVLNTGWLRYRRDCRVTILRAGFGRDHDEPEAQVQVDDQRMRANDIGDARVVRRVTMTIAASVSD